MNETTVFISESDVLSQNETVQRKALGNALIQQDITDNQAVSDPAFYSLIILYALVIIGSVVGNVLVITAVLKSPKMRKVNNILIVNLAISDLLLCTIVSPLTLVQILYKRWIGPKTQWPCYLSGMGPALFTFVSTLTITGIAIDRYKIIVYSANSRSPQKVSSAIMSLVIIWTLSILVSMPLFFAMNLQVIPMPAPIAKVINDDSIAYCAEEWGKYEKGRLIYSCFSILVQFILPITLISWAHHSIKQKLQKLPTWNKASQRKSLKKTNGHCAIEAKNDEAEEAAALAASADSEDKKRPTIKRLSRFRGSLARPAAAERETIEMESNLELSRKGSNVLALQTTRLREKIKKQSRTHALLVSIVVVFALSWFPLNLLNIILDVHNIFESEEAGRICFAFCHLIGMSSAFSNPILYGWFNEAFQDEFTSIGRSLMCKMDLNENETNPNEDQNKILPNVKIPNGNNEKSETKRPSKKMCVTHSNVKKHVELPIVENNSNSGANIEIIRATAIEKNNGHFV